MNPMVSRQPMILTPPPPPLHKSATTYQIYSSSVSKTLKRCKRRKLIDGDFLPAEKCGYKYMIFPFLLLFSNTSRSRKKKLNTFLEFTRSLLYAGGILLRFSDTKHLRLCLFKTAFVAALQQPLKQCTCFLGHPV